MKFKTAEEKLLHDYEELQNYYALALETIEKLKNKQQEENGLAEEPVFIKTISKEVCILSTKDSYYISKNETFKSLSVKEIKEIIDDREQLEVYANLPYGNDRWEKEAFVHVSTSVFPYTATIQNQCILINTWESSDDFQVSVSVLKTKEIKGNQYFDISKRDELYEYGLKKFKEELEKYYQERLKQEEK